MTIAKQPHIAFIGAGNMAHCIISGLISHQYPPTLITASNPDKEKLDMLKTEFHIQCSEHNTTACENADIIVLAVKPQIMKEVVKELKPLIQKKKPLIISIAISISVEKISEWLETDVPIVRCMPNLGAFVQSGATGLYANKMVSPLQRELAENMMRAVGLTIWTNDEKMIDVIAAVSGSGPAYFFMVMESMEACALEMGLSSEDARLFIAQTCLGAAKLALSSEEPPAELRARVTSKGGSTERAIAVLESSHLRETFNKALKAAHARSLELSQLIE